MSTRPHQLGIRRDWEAKGRRYHARQGTKDWGSDLERVRSNSTGPPAHNIVGAAAKDGRATAPTGPQAQARGAMHCQTVCGATSELVGRDWGVHLDQPGCQVCGWLHQDSDGSDVCSTSANRRRHVAVGHRHLPDWQGWAWAMTAATATAAPVMGVATRTHELDTSCAHMHIVRGPRSNGATGSGPVHQSSIVAIPQFGWLRGHQHRRRLRPRRSGLQLTG